MNKLFLTFNEKIVGIIMKCEKDDGLWMVGDIQITDFGYELEEFLKSLTDEVGVLDTTIEYPEGFMNERNWSIIDQQNGIVRSIELPAIFFNDSSIYWRWI